MCNSQYNSFKHKGLKLQFAVKLYVSYTLHWDNVLKEINTVRSCKQNVTNTNKNITFDPLLGTSRKKKRKK